MARLFLCGLMGADLARAALAGTLILPTDDPARWQANPDGGSAPVVSSGSAYEGRPTLRFTYKNVCGYGNSRLDNVVVPPNAYGVRFKLRVEDASPEAVIHLWCHEKDGDLWMCAVTPEDGKGIGAVKDEWRSVFVPFSLLRYQPRGDKKSVFSAWIIFCWGSISVIRKFASPI